MSILNFRKSLAALTACFIVTAVAAPASAAAKVGEKAPDFTLTDLNGEEHKLSAYTEQGKIVVLEWFNAGCPFVKRHYKDGAQTMNKLAEKYREQNVVWLRINSGAPGKQGTGLDYNKKIAEKWRMKDPILLDETGVVGKSFNAKNTPAMAVINIDGVLAYWGAIDDDPRGRKENPVNHVDLALTQVLAGETVTTAETKPYGCSVKY